MSKVNNLKNSEMIANIVTAAAKGDQVTLENLRKANLVSENTFNEAVSNGQAFAAFASQQN